MLNSAPITDLPLETLFKKLAYEGTGIAGPMSACLMGSDLLDSTTSFVNEEHIKGKSFDVVSPGLLSGFLLFNGLSASTQKKLANGTGKHRLLIFDTEDLIVRSGLIALKEAASKSVSFATLETNFYGMLKDAIDLIENCSPDDSDRARHFLEDYLPVRLASIANAFNDKKHGYAAFCQLLSTASVHYCDYTETDAVIAQLTTNKIDIANTAFMFSNVEAYISKGGKSIRGLSTHLEGKCLSITHTSFLPSWYKEASSSCIWMICGKNRKDGFYTDAKLAHLQELTLRSEKMCPKMIELDISAIEHGAISGMTVDAITSMLEVDIQILRFVVLCNIKGMQEMSISTDSLEAGTRAKAIQTYNPVDSLSNLKRPKEFLPAAATSKKQQTKTTSVPPAPTVKAKKKREELTDFEKNLQKAGRHGSLFG